MKPLFRSILAICVISFNSLVLNAQLEFAGTWILDHTKSNAEFRDYQITCIIKQTTKTFTVAQLLVTKNGVKTDMPVVVYNLDGKEVIKEDQEGKSILIAKWATPDQKTLMVRYMRKISGAEVGTVTIYKLSENDQFLTIKSSDLTGDSPIIQVYKKK